MIKRYEIADGHHAALRYLEEDDNGDWVKWEDVKEALLKYGKCLTNCPTHRTIDGVCECGYRSAADAPTSGRINQTP